jgi:glucosamine 6-phosphate synthetase-like amidotransferase/phosphosugar isomerase protein
MPVLQFMAYYKSLSRGNDPDNPKNLHYFVELEDRSGDEREKNQ